jgi:hypothetical protein
MVKCFLAVLLASGHYMAPLRAGAAEVNVTPSTLPVIASCGFLERTVD